MIRGAVISPCGMYRHILSRIWDESGPMVTFCGLNPSVADADVDDPTMRREVCFAQGWGFGGLWKVNAYDFRSSSPSILKAVKHPSSARNWGFIKTAALSSDMFVCCWGTHVNRAIPSTQEDLCRMLLDLGISLYALRLTQGMRPSHTLYLPGDLEPFRWQNPDP